MNHFDDDEDLETFKRLVETFDPDGELLAAWKLEGGVSTQVTGIEVGQRGGWSSKLVVRRYGAADVARNPNVAADEFNLLRAVGESGLPAPAPIFFDQSNEFFPGPLLVAEYIEGATEFAPVILSDHLAQVADKLAQIHAIDHIQHGLSFLREEPDPIEGWHANLRSASIDPLISERIMRATADIGQVSCTNGHCLLHGDFWSGNLLWRNGLLVGIIDWEDAAVGDPLADLAKCRLEFHWSFGAEAAVELTERYLENSPAVDVTDLPKWDLSMASRMAAKFPTWGLSEPDETAMRDSIIAFTDQATSALHPGTPA